MRLTFLAPLCAVILAGCASASTAEIAPHGLPPQSAQEALRPYYAGLMQSLPKAPAGIAIDESKAITRFAFGSCVNENRAMNFWDVIAAQKPQLFLLIGDNVYGDTGTTMAADVPTLGNSYRKLNSRQEFTRFRGNIPMMTTWDDHDYGANDSGGSFAFKEYTEKMYEEYWGSSAEVRSRPGIYESRIIGPQGKRVQFIFLDTRFFRSDHARRPYQDPAPALGWTIPNMDPNATMLGGVQWQWLETELSKPADLRFIISSVQVISSAHGYEGWFAFPKERERLYAMMSDKHVSNAIFLSGDRHSGAMYKAQIAGMKSPIWEFTSSSLNFAFGSGDSSEREPDPARTGGFWSIENFGQIDIDWAAKTVKMSLKKSDGILIEEQMIRPIG